MKARVVGISRLDFKSQDGNQIKGTKLHSAFRNEHVEGLAVESFFCNDSISLPTGLKPNDEVEIFSINAARSRLCKR